jgi:hypothetical protein
MELPFSSDQPLNQLFPRSTTPLSCDFLFPSLVVLIYGITRFSYSGIYMGTVIAMPLAGILAEYVSWESIFYVFGKLLNLIFGLEKEFTIVVFAWQV